MKFFTHNFGSVSILKISIGDKIVRYIKPPQQLKQELPLNKKPGGYDQLRPIVFVDMRATTDRPLYHSLES